MNKLDRETILAVIKTVSLHNEKIAEYFQGFDCIVAKGIFNADLQRHILTIKIK